MNWTQISENLMNNSQTCSNTIEINQIAWCIIDVALLVSILCGNVLTICAICCSYKLAAVLSNRFVLSLAISDLLVGLTLPYHMVFYLCQELGQRKETCLLRFILIMLSCCASIYNLIIIAVDRYIAIIYPLHYCRIASIIVTMGWLCAFGLAAVPIYWNTYSKDKACELEQVLPKNYVVWVLTPAFLCVWLVMLTLYSRIWHEAKGQAKRLQNLQSGISDRKSVQMVMMILGSFSVCWLPYFAVSCTRVYGLNTTPESCYSYKIAFSLGMANSCINPVIYAWKNSEFKQAFGRLLHCRSPQTSGSLCTDQTSINLNTRRNTTHNANLELHSVSSDISQM